MKLMSSCLVALGFTCGLLGSPAMADSVGLVIAGNSANESDAQHLASLAARTNAALKSRGIAQVTVLDQKVTEAAILGALDAASKQTREGDECWVVLLGHGGRCRDREPTFQVKGPRLAASRLRDALQKIPGAKSILIGTSESGGFLPYLKAPGTAAIAATSEEGEVNTPRFPEKWVESLERNPKASFAQIAALASQLTDKEYTQASLAVLEHARFLDPVSGEILAAPFGVKGEEQLAVNNPPPSPGAPASPMDPKNIEIPDLKKDELFRTLPPSAETKALIAEAQQRARAFEDYQAVITQQQMALTVNAGRSVTEESKQAVFLAKPESLHQWASRSFQHVPPAFQTTIQSARLILPDGSSVVLNIDKLEVDTTVKELPLGSTIHFEFPQAVPGSLVEVAWKSTSLPDFSLPQFYREIPLQAEIPACETELTLKLPKTEPYHYHLKNLTAQPQETETEQSKVLCWKLGKIPAYEPLPFDPPEHDASAWLGISSFGSWDDFGAWYRRITKGSDEITPAVQAKADELNRTAQTREARIKGAFEYVASLRYVAVECGIAGLRPRTPEQVLTKRYGDCKDKANLLGALLRGMQIPAAFALVNRMSSTDSAFPGWQFNHAIAYVPAAPGEGQASDLWLDTTDTTTPYGSLPPGDEGRSALVFEKEKLHFQTIQTSGTTLIRDEWRLEGEPGSGHFSGTRTGLADDGIRKRLRSATPLQRAYSLRAMLTAMNATADFENVQMTDLTNLGEPVRVDADFHRGLPSGTAPEPAYDFRSMVLLPERNRPLCANDGQPLKYEQLISFPMEKGSVASPLPPSFQREAAGWRCRIEYSYLDPTHGPKTLLRTASCEIGAPKVEAADYPAVREMLRLWLDALRPIPPTAPHQAP
ncbi:MAG: DUF3857 domain-containing protein [Chthoniobacteraceae bacterium]